MFTLSLVSPSFSQNRDIHITETKNHPRIDGRLDDSVWLAVEKHSGFYQYDPYNGEAASENTTVMLAYDKDNLYVAFKCDDSKPAEIAAFLTPREQFDERGNDGVTLILDTFNDQRTSYEFKVNPRGVQADEPGNYLWQSAAQITSDGWQTEIKIPFKSIRFPKNEEQIWGINFERYIFRLQETDFYTQVGRDDLFLDKSARLTGLRGISVGSNLEFFPYAGLRGSRGFNEDTGRRETDSKFAVGLDTRYALTSDLNLDMTVSPDFSDVESDPFFFQLTPFEVELQERRPFFQEGRRFFPESPGPSLFYSKRIDNPRMAAKVTGRQGRNTIGVIGAINKENNRDGYIGALSLQRDVLEFSTVGAMLSGYSTDEYDNLNGKVNFEFRPSRVFTWEGSAQFAHNSDIQGAENKFYQMGVEYEPDEGWNAELVLERIEKDFQPRAGIFGVLDIQRLFIQPEYRFRLNKNGIKEIDLEWFFSIEQATDGTPVRYFVRPLEFRLSSLRNHEVGLEFNLGRRKLQLEGEDGTLFWGTQDFNESEVRLRAEYEGNRFYQIDASIEYARRPVYDSDDFSQALDGQELEAELSLSLKPAPTLEFAVETEYTRQARRYDGKTLFEGAITDFQFNWQLSRHVFFNTVFQHDSEEDRMKIDVLLGIELDDLGNSLSVAYKSSGKTPITNALTGDEASTFLVKGSYLFRM